MKDPRLVLLSCLLLATSTARADCPGGGKMLEERRARLTGPAVELLTRFLERRPTCSAFGSLLRQLSGEERHMGFRLEDPRAPDRVAAEASLDKALGDPEVRSRLDRIAETTPDAGLRLALEAAVLDDEGYYAARDLKVARLKEQLR